MIKKILFIIAFFFHLNAFSKEAKVRKFDLVVLQATPSGIMAAIAAAREGKTVAILERTNHIGGLPANGLGATDIHTRGATGGLFKEFVERVFDYYKQRYGDTSAQAKDCNQGFHFEPSVAEEIFIAMLWETPSVRVFKKMEFDPKAENVEKKDNRIQRIKVHKLHRKAFEWFEAKVFIDASYEGDLAAASGCRFRIGRESKAEFGEPMAGKIYKKWGGEVGEGTTNEGDTSIQAYNYRLCLTKVKGNRQIIKMPEGYNREEYLPLGEDIKKGLVNGIFQSKTKPGIFNAVRLPNGKTDANNHHLLLTSSDLPEENWPYPKASWEWRDAFAKRLKNYTLGLIFFAQIDTMLPRSFREAALEYGLARDEYRDNNHFPRQMYVREARRIEGLHIFTAHDALPELNKVRPPVHENSITASHYAIDAHASRKREPNRVHLDGFISYQTKPYTVPYGVIVPQDLDNLLVSTAVSSSHVGFGTLRMEPCWMALGQAAGLAATQHINENQQLKRLDVPKLQTKLLEQNAVLFYVTDMSFDSHPDHFAAVQYFGLRGFFDSWEFKPDEYITKEQAQEWSFKIGLDYIADPFSEGTTTRAEYLKTLFEHPGRKI